MTLMLGERVHFQFWPYFIFSFALFQTTMVRHIYTLKFYYNIPYIQDKNFTFR